MDKLHFWGIEERYMGFGKLLWHLKLQTRGIRQLIQSNSISIKLSQKENPNNYSMLYKDESIF